MPNLYDSFENENGSDIVRETYEKFKAPATGSLVLRELLLRHAEDARNRSLTLVPSQSMPGKKVEISDGSQAARVVGQALSIVLGNMMTNFTTGAYSLMATHGKLI